MSIIKRKTSVDAIYGSSFVFICVFVNTFASLVVDYYATLAKDVFCIQMACAHYARTKNSPR